MLTKAVRPGRTTDPGPSGRRSPPAPAPSRCSRRWAPPWRAAPGQAEASAPPIELVTAYVGVPHDGNPTDAYVAIRNNGNADQLVSVHTSVGGTVTLRGPAGASPDIERDFSSIPIPGHTLVRLNPTSYHLVISGARPMKAGTEITLTLVFAHDGSYQIPAEVTNPQTGGASYFLN